MLISDVSSAGLSSANRNPASLEPPKNKCLLCGTSWSINNEVAATGEANSTSGNRNLVISIAGVGCTFITS